MKTLNIDLNIDKHDTPTLVIECPTCKHELTHHLKSLTPDSIIQCDKCEATIGLTSQDLENAESLYGRILKAEDGLIS